MLGVAALAALEVPWHRLAAVHAAKVRPCQISLRTLVYWKAFSMLGGWDKWSDELMLCRSGHGSGPGIVSHISSPSILKVRRRIVRTLDVEDNGALPLCTDCDLDVVVGVVGL